MSRYKRVPLNELVVDPTYQRVLDVKRVERIADVGIRGPYKKRTKEVAR